MGSIKADQIFSIINPGKNEKNILAHTSGIGDAGEINVLADSIIMYGASLESWTLAGATGNSGEINFTAQNMSVQNGGGGVNTFSQGRGGIIHLDIAENLKIKSGGFGAEVRDRGDGGVIRINAQNLEILYGGLGVATYGAGTGGTIDLNIANDLKATSGGFGADALDEGNGGKIEINAQNLELYNAGMGANTRGKGNGGKIRINAETILFQDGIIGAELGTNPDERNIDEQDLQKQFNARNAGDGGNIFIKAQSLLIDNGNITTTTVGLGNAGNITLKVNSLKAIGGDDITGVNSFTDGSGDGGDITITADQLDLSDDARISADSTNIGQAGDVTIYASKLFQLQNKGMVSVDGGQQGSPGNISIRSPDLILNQGKISATTTKGKQGNINLQGNHLFLRDRSEIVTNASEDATGGNIFINLQDNLLGVGNSRITASAERGQGGNIQIITKGIFLSADSKINASSEFGIDGLIKIDALAVNPNSGLIQLPNEPIDSSLYLSKGCGENNNHQFINVGRGGLPANPLNNLIQDSMLADWETSSKLTPRLDLRGKPAHPSRSNIVKPSLKPRPFTNSNTSLIEAQNWKVNQSGKIELVAVSNQNNLTSIDNQTSCLK